MIDAAIRCALSLIPYPLSLVPRETREELSTMCNLSAGIVDRVTKQVTREVTASVTKSVTENITKEVTLGNH